MKFAIGLMACIAIAFVFVTSPESQPRASMESESVRLQAQALTELTRAVTELQNSIAIEREDFDQRVNARLVAFTDELASQSPAKKSTEASLPVPDSDELYFAIGKLELKQKELDARVKELEDLRASMKTASAYPSESGTKSGGSNGGSTGSSQVTTVRTYQPRWRNNDGKTPRDHALSHGFDPSMSDIELAIAHDALHDAEGPNAGHTTTITRNVTRTRSNQQTYSQCPDGVNCPQQVQQTSGPGLPSFTRRRVARIGHLGEQVVNITINGIPLLPGQAKAVAIAAAMAETELAAKPETGDAHKDDPTKALLKLVREVRELIQCDRSA